MSHISLTQRIRSLACLGFFLVHLVSTAIPATYADNTDYYIDATSGSDMADGLTPATAWQSLSRIQSGSYLPGDNIRFKCGESYTGSLILQDSGTAGNPIVYGSYGSCTPETKPILAQSGSTSILSGTGLEYITIDGLHFMNSTSTTPAVSLMGTTESLTFIDSRFSGRGTSSSCLSLEYPNNYMIR